MPVRLSNLVKERRELAVPLADSNDVINIVYRPHALTPADEARLSSLTGEESYREMLSQFEDLLVSWDVLGALVDKDTGKVLVPEDVEVPIKQELLQHLPTDLMGIVFGAIREDMRPKQRKGSSSGQRNGLYTESQGSLS